MNAPVSLGLLCPGWDPETGSTESHVQSLARALTAAGVRVVVLAADRTGRTAPYAQRETTAAGIRVRRLGLPERVRLRPEDLARDPRAEAAVRDWLLETRPQVLHVHDLASFGLGVVDALAELGIPGVLTLHDYWPVCPKKRMVRTNGELCATPLPETCSACLEATWPRLKISPEEVAGRNRTVAEHLARFQRLVVPSETARSVYAAAGYDPTRIEVVPIGLETQALHARARLARGEHEPTLHLGVIGTARPESGVLELAHALCVANLPQVILDVHGRIPTPNGDSTYRNALQRLANHEPRVRLHGPFEHAELPRVLALLDAVAFPTLWEDPTALALREARAAGLPVIASTRGAARELADDPGITFVEGHRIKAWVDALWSMTWEQRPPPAGASLLGCTVRLLTLYSAVWQERQVA